MRCSSNDMCKAHAIKGLVGCLQCSMIGICHWTYSKDARVRIAIKLNYRNTAPLQKHNTYKNKPIALQTAHDEIKS